MPRNLSNTPGFSSPLTVGQRQVAFGKPVDIPYIPFPFQEILALEELGLRKQKAYEPEPLKSGDRDRADDIWFSEDHSQRLEGLSTIYDKYSGKIDNPVASREIQNVTRDPQYAQNELNRKRSFENINKYEDTLFKLKSEGLSDANAFDAELKVAKWRVPDEKGISGTRAYGVFDLGSSSITKNKDRNEYIKTFMDEAFRKGSYTEQEESTGRYFISKGSEGLAYNDLLRMGGVERYDTGEKDSKGNSVYDFRVSDPTRMQAYFNDDSGKNLINETRYNYFNTTGNLPDDKELEETVRDNYINLVNNQAIEKSGFISKQSLQETTEYKEKTRVKAEDEELFRIHHLVPTHAQGPSLLTLQDPNKRGALFSVGIIAQQSGAITNAKKAKEEYIKANKGKGVLGEIAKYDASIEQLERGKKDYETYIKGIWKKAATDIGISDVEYNTILDDIKKGIHPQARGGSKRRDIWEEKIKELLLKDAKGKDIAIGTIKTPSKALNASLEEDFRVNFSGKAIFDPLTGEDISDKYKDNTPFGPTDTPSAPVAGDIHFLGVGYHPKYGLVNYYNHDIKEIQTIDNKDYVIRTRSNPIFTPAEGGLSEMIDNFRGDKQALRTMITGGITNIVNTSSQTGVLFGVGLRYLKASDKPGAVTKEQYEMTIKDKSGKSYVVNYDSMEEVVNKVLNLYKK